VLVVEQPVNKVASDLGECGAGNRWGIVSW